MTGYALDRVRLRLEPRRPDGTLADVEALWMAWQRLFAVTPDLAVEDRDKAAEQMAACAAVAVARVRVSQRQEWGVFRSLMPWRLRWALVAWLPHRGGGCGG